MSCDFKTLSDVFLLWKSLLRQAWPILVISCIAGSLFTLLERGNRREDGSLSVLYWGTAEMNSVFGFAVDVIWPFIICGWIANKYGFVLLGLCLITDFTFRIAYWKLEHLWRHSPGIISEHLIHTYLSVWALFNDLNSWVWVPLMVYIFQNTKHKNYDSDSIELVQVQHLVPPNTHSIQSNTRKVSKVLRYAIAFTIIWFISQDVYEYYVRNSESYPRFLPLILVFIGLMYDLRLSVKQKRSLFSSLWYMIGYVLTQNLFSAWANLTISLVASASHLFGLNASDWIENALARMVIFVAYQLSFRFLQYIGHTFAMHSSHNHNKYNSFHLEFIFMIYSNYFVFQFITLTNFNLTFFATLIAKEIWTIIRLHPVLRAKSKIFSNNPLDAWLAYVYAILISWIVLSCQCCVIYVDYFQSFERTKEDWLFGNNKKTRHNLVLATSIILITLICDMIVYLLLYSSQRNNVRQFEQQRFSDRYFEMDLMHRRLSKDSECDEIKQNRDDVICVGKCTNAVNILYIPFHLWYYTCVSSLVAMRCTAIIFTDLYHYFT
eukprot:809273_1